MRRSFIGAIVAATFLRVAALAACSPFDSAPVSLHDAGVDVRVDAPTHADADADAHAEADADAGSTPCLSKHAEDDGGCDPVVFITPDSYKGDLGGDGGVDRADAICAELGAPWVFKAWLSDEAHAAAGIRFTEIGSGASRTVYLVDGTRVVDSYNVLIEKGQPDKAINRTLKGGLVADNEEVWTGTSIDGTLAFDCEGWTTSQQSLLGNAGRAGSNDHGWTAYEPQASCDQPKHLYCFEIVQ